MSSEAPKRKSSGEMAAAYRAKHDSVAETTLPMVDSLTKRIDRLMDRVVRNTPIPRGEPGDPRSEPHIDIVRLPSHPRVPRPRETVIVVNGTRYVTSTRSLSYDDVCRLALEVGMPSITYKIRSTETRGILAPGDRIVVSDGLVFNVVRTEGA